MPKPTRNKAAIAVGSNIEPTRHIAQARQAVAADQHLLAESDFVLTTPIGGKSQPDYSNGAWLVETALDLEQLRDFLKQVETDCGRQRSSDKYAPREIDLDIVVWNGQIIDPDYYERDFLQTTIRQVLPDLVAGS